MMTVLYVFLALHLGIGIALLFTSVDKNGKNYALRHPFGAMMIFLFGTIVAVVWLVRRLHRDHVWRRMDARIRNTAPDLDARIQDENS